MSEMKYRWDEVPTYWQTMVPVMGLHPGSPKGIDKEFFFDSSRNSYLAVLVSRLILRKWVFWFYSGTLRLACLLLRPRRCFGIPYLHFPQTTHCPD